MINVLIYNARGQHFLWKWTDGNFDAARRSVMDMVGTSNFTYLDAAIVCQTMRQKELKK